MTDADADRASKIVRDSVYQLNELNDRCDNCLIESSERDLLASIIVGAVVRQGIRLELADEWLGEARAW